MAIPAINLRKNVLSRRSIAAISQIPCSNRPRSLYCNQMAARQQHLRYHLVLRPEPEGGFTVIVPALPGCITYGKNLREAKRMAADAVRAYLASLRKHGEPIPSDDETLFTSLELRTSSRKRTPAYA